MNALELRHKIIEQLSLIEDAAFLNAIRTIVESKAKEVEYKLSEFQKQRIEMARAELSNGEAIENDDLQKELDQWLDTK
ncbi:hypothetical protein GC194_00330 [bacterium]|nr:hypothetical protein [bacterium]